MVMLAMRVDQVMLFKLRGAQEVGYYAVAVRVTEALSMLPEALMLSVFPILAASLHSAPERFRHTYRLSFKYLTTIILPVALAFTLARHELVALVFGASYAGGATALAILAWGMFFGYTGAVYLNLFIVHSLHRLMLVVSLVALTVNIGLNLWLIPRYGAAGAAAATVFSNIVGFGFWLAHPQTAPFMRVCAQEALRPLLSVAAAWLGVWASGTTGFTAAGLSLLIFVAVLAALRGFTWSDVDLMRRMFAGEDASKLALGERHPAEP
jgi:O-antigen/teichoic acid export membrane protein